MSRLLEPCLVREIDEIRRAIACIDGNASRIALVVDENRRLVGTLTDGDIRRSVLAGIKLEEHVSRILERKQSSPYPKPVTALPGTSMSLLQGLMRQHAIRQIPIVDELGFLVDLIVDSDLAKDNGPGLRAVIMAGGKGSRLYPLTENTPKPMLPVGGRPIMEWIVEQLRDSGIHRIHVSTHFQSEKISEHFGDGNAFGVDIQYVSEERPLGTAGALSLLERSAEPLLVVNGDILTQVNFRAMYDYHREHQAEMTVGVRHYEFQVPYGVVECNESRITALREKPVQQFFVNAGIYLLEPSVFRFIPEHQRQDMTEVIDRLLKVGANVVSFPIMETWIDIGQHADYEKAQSEIERRSQ